MFQLFVLAALIGCLPVESATPRLVTYIDRLSSYWGASNVAAALGVPGYAQNSSYNVINLAFWTSSGYIADAANMWAFPLNYMDSNPWGTTNQQIQQAWIKLYHAQGIKVLVSAFGSTDNPTSAGADPTTVAKNLAAFVINNNLDGVDLDWEDNAAMNAGKGEQWLITCTLTLRSLLPSPQYLITHAPQAPYFTGKPIYVNGGYLTVDAQAGYAIDFYNIQFYNQGDSTYDTYDTLFVASNGYFVNTAVMQIAAHVNITKLVVGKPVTTGDATNTGFVPLSTLSQYISQGIASTNWRAGIMGWQYYSDIYLTGNTWINTLAKDF